MSDPIQLKEKITINTGHEWRTIQVPEKSQWTFVLINIRYNPNKKDEPNWFRRKMMEFFFSGKWLKI